MEAVAIVGGTSALARRLTVAMKDRFLTVTLGRHGCDIYCDLLDPIDKINIPKGIRKVILVAAAFGGAGDDEGLKTISTNVEGTFKVCVAAKRAGVKQLVVISSMSAVLGAESPYYGIYAITKRQAEEIAEEYGRRYSIRMAVLRPAQLYSDDESFRDHQPLLYQMADRAEQGKDIEIFGRHDALRNYLHADDMAEIVTRVAEMECMGVHACVHPRDVRLSEMAQAAQRAFGRGGAIVFRGDQPDIPDNVFGNDDRLFRQVGYYPLVDLPEGFERIASWRKNSKR